MKDLNELLKWSLANSAPSQNGHSDPSSTDSTEQLSLTFNPTTNASAGSSALHASDPYGHPDLSPASTPGPATPSGGSNSFPNLGKSQPSASEILDLIMGRPDSAIMKEKMEFAVDEKQDVDARVEALDDFEMLIELIDNANNMVVLKLWEPLLSLLESPHTEIVSHACWIAGTACQNNLQAQAAFFNNDAFPLLLPLLSPSKPTSIRSKALYALSSTLKHWPLASSILSSTPNAYPTLAQLTSDPSPIIRRKASFLIGTLVMQSGMSYEGEIPTVVADLLKSKIEERKKIGVADEESLVDGLKKNGVFIALLKSLSGSSEEDVEFEENAMRALSRAAEKGGLNFEEKAQLKTIFDSLGEQGRSDRGLDGGDGKDIATILSA